MTETSRGTGAGTGTPHPDAAGPGTTAPGATGHGRATTGDPGTGPAVDPARAAAAPSGADATPTGDTSPEPPARYAPEWLALRESADAAARNPDLLTPLRRYLTGSGGGSGTTPATPAAEAATAPLSPDGLVVRDLGCGTGSMARWLAPRLTGRQSWILHDHDPILLALAVARMPEAAADGAPVRAAARRGDISRLTAETLAGTSLVTASALLDLLTREEVAALAAACAGARCPALLALSVAGRVAFDPADPLDGDLAEAFNAHQRRTVDGRRLLGPDAVEVAVEEFARHGMTVRTAPSPWHLVPGGYGAALAAEWLRGWVGAAREQRPEPAAEAEAYLERRLAQCAADELRVTVHHTDLLALPPGETP
ncbi:class I SAM-dependent methyltransferase [Streptomyces zingiberis]|uniref:class I SAM-dependent methyltransferase n=1 Tax=Streptomyces zingiberis TaxID=2053010 RepID=UPI001F0FD9AD|nr:class I SAM-dependent methyltransferase [Streptomyces zingiberis]